MQNPIWAKRQLEPPLPAEEQKFWPVVGRVDNAYGDRNLVCSCEGMEAYSS